MNPVKEQIIKIYKEMPLSKKIMMGIIMGFVFTGFISIFIWANKTDYQILYSGISSEDAFKIVEKLKEQKIPYQLSGNGSIIMVPAKKLYDLRLSLAGEGLPNEKTVGFEIFDETTFGTTEFVQNLNYQRALQGELAKTIKEFKEIEDAKVMIVMAKESVFIEEERPASASVLLKLKKKLSKEKISSVVYLVASSVDNLNSDQVTVVDTNGNMLSRGTGEEEINSMANTQLEYKTNFEQLKAIRIQTMLEKIVGKGKAIVRVTADMDFDQIDLNEEIYDPDTFVVRSSNNIVETADKKTGPAGDVSSVNPVTSTGPQGIARKSEIKNEKKNETINYEINRQIKKTTKSVGKLNRLSVVAVLDGNYTFEKNEAGTKKKIYNPRTKSELDRFAVIVRQAMGYNADREDQVSVESFPFFLEMDGMLTEKTEFDFHNFIKKYGKSLLNIFVILLLFIFVVLPFVKSIQEIKTKAIEDAEELKRLENEKKEALPEPVKLTSVDQAMLFANDNIDKTVKILKIWAMEQEQK